MNFSFSSYIPHIFISCSESIKKFLCTICIHAQDKEIIFTFIVQESVISSIYRWEQGYQGIVYYHISFLHFSQSDINECQTGAHNCDINAWCKNTQGSYTCECHSGFTANGIACDGELSLIFNYC